MLMVKCLVSLFIDLISAINSMDLADMFLGTLHYDLKLFCNLSDPCSFGNHRPVCEDE